MRAPVLGSMLAALALLCGCGDQPAPAIQALEIGARLEADVRLPEVGGGAAAVTVTEILGAHATVFLAWSVPCPCVDSVEARIQKLFRAHPPEQGVAWIALAGEPLDTPEQLREKQLRLGSPYRILRDAEQQLCRRVGFDSAVQVAVFDAKARLRYRGALDDDQVDGDGAFLRDALAAVLAGKAPAVPERARTYGCTFSDPASCTQLR